jgi:glutathionyl-hydroquinone reductase
MSEYKKYRKHSKVYDLPKEIKKELDNKLFDTSITYTEITEWLTKKGYNISRSTVGRYAIDTKKLGARLQETRERVKEIVKLAKENEGENITQGAFEIAINQLTEKIAMMGDEIDELDPVQAIMLLTHIGRTKAYEDKVYANLKNQYDKVYKEYMKALYKEIEDYPELIEKLEIIANKTLGKLTSKNSD